MNTDRTRSQPPPGAMRVCPYCNGLFPPKRLRQDFCGDPCRTSFHRDVGTQGVVAGVTRLKRGVSVVIHYPDGPSAERAIALRKGQSVRTVGSMREPD